MQRDDLLTHIHKALRKGLFEAAIQAGSTDWSSRRDVDSLAATWRPLRDLLDAHAHHEDRHIFGLLDPVGDEVVAATREHEALEKQLDDLDSQFERALNDRDADVGLDVYRELVRFIAAYLPHLHHEETVIMSRIWEERSDADIAATRAAFMAEVSPEQSALTMELMLPALDRTTRNALVANVASTAPEIVVDNIIATAEKVLPGEETVALRDAAARSTGSAG